MTRACAIARVLCVGPGQALVANCNSRLPSRGAERRQALGLARPPVGGLRNTPDGTSCDRPVPPLRSGGTRLPALHLRRSATGRAALSRTWTSHACQPAPGAGSYCPGAEPRHRPRVRSALLRTRGAASIDGGISPVIDPVGSGRISGLVPTAAPSSRRPMTTPLEEQDGPIVGISAYMSIVLR